VPRTPPRCPQPGTMPSDSVTLPRRAPRDLARHPRPSPGSGEETPDVLPLAPVLAVPWPCVSEQSSFGRPAEQQHVVAGPDDPASLARGWAMSWTSFQTAPSNSHVSFCSSRLVVSRPPKRTTRSRTESKASDKTWRSDGPVLVSCVQAVPSQAYVPLPPKELAEPLSRTVTCRAASYTMLEVNKGAWGPSSSKSRR
jgi:hypothetical protein